MRKSWKSKEVLWQLQSSSTNVHIVGEDLLTALCELFSLRFCVSSVAKILQGIWETFLHENNHNYNSYKFSYKFTFIPFLSFRKSQKQESNFQQVGGLVSKCFFIASCALLQSYAKFNKLL